MEDRLQTLVQKIRQHGHRLTPQRMAILRILADSTGHPTVEQVYEQVRAQFPMTSLATVYKTVTLLKEEGEILELSFGGESSRYDGHNPHPHPHLICIRCGTILDPDLALFNDLPREICDKYGFQMVNHRVDFFGICPACQQAQSVSTTSTPQGKEQEF